MEDSAGGGRSRRAAPRNNIKSKALSELAALRRGEVKRADQFDLKEEEDVYDIVDERTYKELVAKRREENGG